MGKNDFLTACAPTQAIERLDLSTVSNEKNGIEEVVSKADEAQSAEEVTTRYDLYQYVWTWVHDTANFRWTYNPPSLATEADKILAIFRELYAAEPVHTLEIKKDCLRRAYWDVYRSDYISFSDLEIYLMMKALEFLMTATRFKKMMKAAGADIDEDEGAWLEGWNIASHFVLYGSEAVMKFRRSRKNNPLLFDEDVMEPFFETKRIKELIDCSNPYYMESLLAYPDFDVQEKERELNKRWLECRLI